MDRAVGIFYGVRFVLLGFDSVSEGQCRLELTQKGGVDLGKYDHRCTHVIVSGLLYDDPVCVLARSEGKIVVNETWIDDSMDLGILADPTRVLYRPVKDLNGIPGAQSFHICLTGYQRQERDDIMRMVNLMGARFSKPLIANQVTHLICYKFEGEKYELAKKVNIKLVNHCWLEDCLKSWAIQPEESYTKSGYELELEAEARDSDEETDDDVAPVKTDHAFNARTPIYTGSTTSAIPNPPLQSPAPRPFKDNASTSGPKNHTSPIINAKNHTSPVTNAKNHTSPVTNAKNHTSPVTNAKSHTSPVTNAKNHTSPVTNAKNHTSSVINAKSHTSPVINASRTPNRPSQNSNLSPKSHAPGSYQEIDVRGSRNSPDMKLNGEITCEKSPSVPVKTLLITSDQTPYKTTSPLQYSGPHINTPGPSPVSEPSTIKNSALQYSGSRINSSAPSPVSEPSTTNNSALQYSGSCIKSPAPSPVNEPSTANNSVTTPRTDIGPEKKSSKKSSLASSNQTANTPKPTMSSLPAKSPLLSVSPAPSPHGDNGLEKMPIMLVKSLSVTQGTPKSDDKSQNLAKTPFQEIASDQGSGSTNIAKSPLATTEMLGSTKDATLNLSANKEIDSEIEINSNNVVQTGIKGKINATPQSEIGLRKTLSLSSKPPLMKTPAVMISSDQKGTKKGHITPQCKEFSSRGEPGSCEPVQTSPNVSAASSLCGTKKGQITPQCKELNSGHEPGSCEPVQVTSTIGVSSSVSSKGTATTSKLSYTRKLRKKSISPIEQPSNHSVNIAPKVDLGIPPQVVDSGTGGASGNVEMDKCAEKSSSVLPQKRKASDESNSSSPFVANDFKELEQLNSLSKGDSVVEGVTGTGTNTNKPVRKTLSEKRKSLKRAKPPKYSPSVINRKCDEKMEEGNAQQPNTLDMSKAPEAVTIVPQNYGNIEMRNELQQSKKIAESKPKMLEIKGLSPDSMEIDSKKPSYEPSDENNANSNSNFKLAPSTRIKKAVAKRSIKSAQANPGTSSFNRKFVNNNADTDAAKRRVTEMEMDKKNVKGNLKEVIRKEGDDNGTNLGADKRKGKDKAEVSERSRSASNKSNITMDWLLTSLELDPEKENKQDEKSYKTAVRKSNKRPVLAHSSKNRQVVEANGNGNGNGNGRTVAKADGNGNGHGRTVAKEDGNGNGNGRIVAKEDGNGNGRIVAKEDGNGHGRTVAKEDGNGNGNGGIVAKEDGNGNGRIVAKEDGNGNGRIVAKEDGNGNGRIVASTGSLPFFILSGHSLQKKEFQAVIRKLRGRVCRDSHNWSFQATHFIVPGPLRRTEKFFAAAASGSWVLKMEYLIASNEAGRFVEEEEYEWYGNGLTDDNTISLEAARKWRLLRERTGHGAFYGMHIIIYGQCVAPKLDTLKRVIKAGGGTVLATCPPYSRYLKPGLGVDLCVVPDTTPSDDPWILDFLNHKIPCVTSDFLVEFVCKPGHSLSKHVLFQTHDWVSQTLHKFEKLSQEVKPLTLGDEQELKCVVCGRSDRGDVMLICGDESGSVGCGLGTHVDCCNPKLCTVPQEDWFCETCRALIVHNKPKRGRPAKKAK